MNDFVKGFSWCSVLGVSKVSILVFVLLSPVLVRVDAVAQSSQVSSGQDHECRFWGIIGRPTDMIAEIKNHLYGSGPPNYDSSWPKCLKRLGGSSASFPFDNPDGWGIGYYGYYRTPIIHRGQQPAWDDTNFDAAVDDTANEYTKIAVGHVRKGSDPPTPSDGNPHPFHRNRMGHWLFGHNGWVDRAKVRNLIVGIVNPTQQQLRDHFRDTNNQWQIPKCHRAHHPDGGGGFRLCDPLTDDDACLFGDIQGFPGSELTGIVDSELYFVFLLKHIESAKWNVPNGVTNAVNALETAQAILSALNFFLTDGEALWGLCYYKYNYDRYTLRYWIPNCSWCGAIASSIPAASTTEWIGLKNASLIRLWVESGDVKSQIYTIGGAVGGVVIPVDKFGLLAPYVGLASTILVATVATAIYIKRVKRRKEKQ